MISIYIPLIRDREINTIALAKKENGIISLPQSSDEVYYVYRDFSKIILRFAVDSFQNDQNVMFDWTADITGTGDRSEYIVEVIRKSRRSC